MDIIAAWSAWMTLGGSAPETIRSRTDALRRVERLYGPLQMLDRDQLAAWLMTYAHSGTRSTMLSYARCFYRWAVAEGHLDLDPTRRLPTMRVPRGTPRPIPTPELAVMLSTAPDPERLWAELMAYAGLRVSEVALCQPSDAWRSVEGAWWLRIPRAKGGHDQQVPLPAWLGERLTTAAPWSLDRQTVRRRVCYYLRLAGSDATPHRLRHWYATAALRSTGNLRVVQEMMRHATPASTAIYTKVTSQEATAAAESLPRAAA